MFTQWHECIVLKLLCSAGGFLKNPIDWVRDKVNPGLMEEQSEAEIEAAKAQARKEGTSNLFEDVVDVAPSESGPEVPQTAKTVKSKAFGKTVEEARPDFVRELIYCPTTSF